MTELNRKNEKPVESNKKTIQQAVKTQTESPPTRRYRTLLFQFALLLAICTFSLLTILVKTTASLPVDLQITLGLQSIESQLFAGFMRLISWPGFWPQSLIATLLIAVVFYLYGLTWEAIVVLLASIFTSLTNELIKEIIRRPRPDSGLVDVFAVLKSYSFPSGHVMFYTIVFGFTWYLTYSLLKPSLFRSLLLVLLGSLILLVSISRIYLGQHWASDVLGAYLLGGLILAGIILLYQWGMKRFFIHRPSSTADSNKE